MENISSNYSKTKMTLLKSIKSNFQKRTSPLLKDTNNSSNTVVNRSPNGLFFTTRSSSNHPILRFKRNVNPIMIRHILTLLCKLIPSPNFSLRIFFKQILGNTNMIYISLYLSCFRIRT